MKYETKTKEQHRIAEQAAQDATAAHNRAMAKAPAQPSIANPLLPGAHSYAEPGPNKPAAGKIWNAFGRSGFKQREEPQGNAPTDMAWGYPAAGSSQGGRERPPQEQGYPPGIHPVHVQLPPHQALGQQQQQPPLL